MGGKESVSRVRNSVHEDAIWRQMIRYELNTAKQWEADWGFMKEMYVEQSQETTPKSTKPTNSSFPIKKNYLAEPQAQNFLLAYELDSIKNNLSVEEKYTFPVTSSTEIGWKWHQSQLEKYGSHAKGRRNISRWWSGAAESMP